MKSERLFRILGLIDDALAEEVEPAFSPARRRQSRWLPALAAAACVALACGLIWRMGGLPIGGFGGSGSAADTEDSAAPTDTAGAGADASSSAEFGDSGIVHDTEPVGVAGSAFMSYAGPVFPMTVLEGVDGLAVERKTTWDFSSGTYQDGSPRQWGATVSDSYTLMNASTEELLVMACYPFAGSFAELDVRLPTVRVGGEAVSPTLYAGAYAGGFTHAGVDDGSTWNLDPPDSWADYKALLEDGAYLERALEGDPALDHPITVYTFTDLLAPEGYNASTLALDCTIDPKKTQILSYGFNGFWMEDNGWRRYDFFVPSAIRHGHTTKMLLVLGEDIGDYTLQGYEDGSCGQVLEGVSCTVRRVETTLGEALDELCRLHMEEYLAEAEKTQENLPEFQSIFDLLTLELFENKAAELMAQHGPLAGDGMQDRYSEGRLDDLISDTLTQERVLYLAVPATIPAGGSVDITFSLWKEPSFDFGCSGSESVGLQGYDYVTTLGSSLAFTTQSAALASTEGIVLARQNFGFDPEQGVTEVVLDPAKKHYYMEIRPK